MAYNMSKEALRVRRQRGKKLSIPVMVDGVEYPNMMAAEEVVQYDNLARKLRGKKIGEVVEVNGHEVVRMKDSPVRDGGAKIYKYDVKTGVLLEEYGSISSAACLNGLHESNLSTKTKEGKYTPRNSRVFYSRVKI